MDRSFNLTGCSAVLPDRIAEDCCITVLDGKIAAIGEHPLPELPVIDVEGQFVIPGMIDIHVHGGGGYDFMDGTEKAIRLAAKCHCMHGTTSMVPTTMTCPTAQLIDFIRLFLRVKRAGSGSADLLGIHLEGPYFAAASRGAQPVHSLRIPSPDALNRVLQAGEGEILRWDAAPELEGMEMFAGLMRQHHVMPAIAHSDAVASEAQRAFDWGFCHVTHFYNAVTTYRKLPDTRNYAGIVEAAYLDDRVTLELIGDGRHVPKQSFELALKIKGPDKIAIITDAMRAAGTNAAHSVLGPLNCGTPVTIFDGVAQLPDHSSYAGSIATMDQALRTVHFDFGVPLVESVRMASLVPARLSFVDKRKGSLEIGKDADLVILSPDLHVRKVYIQGEEQRG